MKHITNRKVFIVSLIAYILFIYMHFLIQSCKKLEFERVVRIKTGEISNITSNSASVTGIIQDVGENGITQYGHCWSTTENPTKELETKTDLGIRKDIGSFSSNITDLLPGITYYIRAYATNIEGTAYGVQYSFYTLWDNSTISDYDGNVYSTVQIGGQIWMAENLKTTRYNDGTNISLVTNNTEWNNLLTPAYCWYNNNEAAYKNPYGALYNWYTVNTGKLCPKTWHVPIDEEWTTLTDYLGGINVAGGKLKETDTTHWNSPNTGATNETGFTALPGGYRDSNGTSINVGICGYWWSASENDTDNALYRYMGSHYSGISRKVTNEKIGFSVRCVKD